MIRRFKLWYVRRLISKAVYNADLAADLAVVQKKDGDHIILWRIG